MLWFEITNMLIAVKNNFIVLFIIIFGTLSFPIHTGGGVISEGGIVTHHTKSCPFEGFGKDE